MKRNHIRYRDYSKAWERYHLAGEPPPTRPCPPVPRWLAWLAWVAAVAVLLAIEAVGALAGLWRLGMLR